MVFRATRYVLYSLLFACSTVLLGLTAYRIHYTKSLSDGDILTSRSHFYDPRIAALMVASIVTLIFSIATLGALIASFEIVVAENLGLWVIWIFLLITAALVTRQFSNLKYCRSHHKVCRILETIKAFSWICWGIVTILLVVTLIKILLGNRGNLRTNRNTRGAVAYPDTRQTTTGPTVQEPSRPQATQGGPTSHGASTKQNTSQQQQQQAHQSAPTTTAPGALYQQGIDHRASGEPRQTV